MGPPSRQVEAVPLVSANCLNTSLLTGSTGLASKGRAKRATWLPRHLVRGVGAVGDSKQDNNYHLILCPQSYS